MQEFELSRVSIARFHYIFLAIYFSLMRARWADARADDERRSFPLIGKSANLIISMLPAESRAPALLYRIYILLIRVEFS